MILDFSKVKIFVRTIPTDMRKQTNGLSALVQEEMKLDVFGSNIFGSIQISPKKTSLKAINIGF